MLAVMPRHGAVGGFGLDRLAVRRHQHRGHQAERAVALRDGVGLHVAVVVLAGPDVAARPFHRRGDHVVDQAMFVGDLLGVELRLEFAVENLLEDVLEAAVIGLEDGVLGRQIDRIALGEALVERGAGEIGDRIRRDCTSPCATPALGRLVDFALDHLAVLADEFHRQRALAGELEVGGAVLVAEGVAADDDRLGPARHQPRHVLADDGLAEHHAAENIADGAVRRLPHFLEAEFLHPGFVRGDGGAFDADADLLDGVGGIDGDLIVGLVAVFHPQVEILQVDIEERVDQLVLDVLPDDPGHLVAIEFDDGVGHLDFCHEIGPFWKSAFRAGW